MHDYRGGWAVAATATAALVSAWAALVQVLQHLI